MAAADVPAAAAVGVDEGFGMFEELEWCFDVLEERTLFGSWSGFLGLMESVTTEVIVRACCDMLR